VRLVAEKEKPNGQRLREYRDSALPSLELRLFSPAPIYPEMEEATMISALESLLRRQISGLIVAAVSPDQAYLAPWQERTPVVFVDRAPKQVVAEHQERILLGSSVFDQDMRHGQDGLRSRIAQLRERGRMALRRRRPAL